MAFVLVGLTAACGTSPSADTPMVVKAVAPGAYPELAVQGRVEGRVTVEVAVNRAGEVTEAHMVDLEGPAAIFRRESYERVAREWRFDPNERAPAVRKARIQFVFRVMSRGTPAEKLGTTFLPPYGIEMRAEEPPRE